MHLHRKSLPAELPSATVYCRMADRVLEENMKWNRSIIRFTPSFTQEGLAGEDVQAVARRAACRPHGREVRLIAVSALRLGSGVREDEFLTRKSYKIGALDVTSSSIGGPPAAMPCVPWPSRICWQSFSYQPCPTPYLAAAGQEVSLERSRGRHRSRAFQHVSHV
jgi:hypothetical protein